MKQLLLPVLLIVVLLAGYGKPATVYVADSFTIDTEARTITKDEDVYHYSLSGDTVRFIYPNSAVYRWTYLDMGGCDGGTDDYAPIRYAKGDTLLDLLDVKPPRTAGGGNGFAGILLAFLGSLNLLAPRVSWYLRYGWRFKDAEPSDAALVFTHISGAAFLGIGHFLFF